MENKLTIEHLFPYLSYKLRIRTDHNGSFGRLVNYGELLGVDYVLEVHFADLEKDYWTSIIFVKPYLIPLNDLIPQLVDWLKENNFGNFDISDWIGITKLEYQRAPHFICQKIFELHGDIFDLIPKGLALNKLEYYYGKDKQSKSL